MVIWFLADIDMAWKLQVRIIVKLSCLSATCYHVAVKRGQSDFLYTTGYREKILINLICLLLTDNVWNHVIIVL